MQKCSVRSIQKLRDFLVYKAFLRMFQDRVIAVLPHDFISWKGTQVGNSPQNLQLLHNERELWEGQTINGS